jgi:hypothetical protein
VKKKMSKKEKEKVKKEIDDVDDNKYEIRSSKKDPFLKYKKVK